MKRIVLIAASCAFSLAANSRELEGAGGYAFVHAGLAKHDLDRTDLDGATQRVLGLPAGSFTSSLDDSTIGGGVVLGYRMSTHVALEAGYLSLGEARYRADIAGGLPGGARLDLDLAVRGATLGLAVFAPIGSRFDLHARGGVFFAHSSLRDSIVVGTGPSDSATMTGNSRDGWYAYGVGYALSQKLQITVDSTHFRGVGDKSETITKSVSLLGASLLYRF